MSCEVKSSFGVQNLLRNGESKVHVDAGRYEYCSMLSLRYKPTEGPGGCSSDAPAASSASSSCCSSSSTASLSSEFTASSSMSTQSSQHLVIPSDVDSLKDSLRVLRRQADTTYKCNDYILRDKRMERWQRKPSSSTLSSASHTSGTSMQDLQEDSSVDIACREKMALWSYRIIDHFDGDREIVAIAFNYLDRFLHLCSCDRSAFKLAAITSLFLATKLFSAKYVTMKSLAQLSKGEFDEENLKEMEDILLKTLDYRLHPPTIKCYIDHMMTLMPADRVSEQTRHTIRQRAHFFAELAVLDYSLSIDHPSTVAFAAIMNASEGFDRHCIDYQACAAFIMTVEALAEIDFANENTYVVRDRLWHLYSLSEEAQAGHSSSDNSNTTSTPMAASSPTPFQQEQQSPRSSADYFGSGSAYSPVSILFEGGCCH